MNDLIFLIDAAKAITGSDSKTADALGVSRGNVSDWRHGRQPCSPEMQALLASIAGFDPAETALRAMTKKHEGSALGDKLARVLGKLSPATGVVAGFVGAVALAIFGLITPKPATAQTLDTQCADGRNAERNSAYVKPIPLEK
ncbi:hypothetical protein [uncultured Pseudacidovorax sp.]|uniref:hypothetical protein n=1 Tax=uncultured Pseudacidovorax sp. TaxID=679313 RepID=UPI0025F19C06|nr:hypothetical protein [uncultured Pseudacidovorax sp.]